MIDELKKEIGPMISHRTMLSDSVILREQDIHFDEPVKKHNPQHFGKSNLPRELKKRILVVDDEPFNTLGMQIILKQCDFESIEDITDVAYNGQDALDKVRQGV